MNRTIHHIETLVYYDGPELFLAADQINTKYLCLVVESNNENDRVLCVPISDYRLREFNSGRLDLRSILLSSETEELYCTFFRDHQEQDLLLESIDVEAVPEEWLPEEGFFFQPEVSTNIEAVKEAIETRRTIMYYSVNPPEANNEVKISAEKLSESLRLLQKLIKYAYREALKKLDSVPRKAIDSEDHYRVDVVAVSPGSFKLHLQSANTADLTNFVQISRALEKIDTIFEKVDSTEQSLEVLKFNGGHLVSTYRDLLKFIVDNDSPIAFEWATPDRCTLSSSRISKNQAESIYKLLIEKQELGSEEKNLVGSFNKLDAMNGNWRLISKENNKTYGGKSEPKKDLLRGVTMETKLYKLICEERLEEETVSGKEDTTLWLTTIEEQDE